ncbi:hypothetical protein SLS62_001013 [Diatrype stigma]|uniref:ABC transporter domain-containing protein n=1 Tax=Diatrype stigma TaxID=117547 RepID=A0AAN9V238_9PEZI
MIDSGKSSLLLSFLRLLDCNSGTVKVDGANLSTIPRSTIRERCFVAVPQEPLLLSEATLRFNLDPSETLANHTILDVLDKVHMKRHFSSAIQHHLSSAGSPSHDPPPPSHDPMLDRELGSFPPLSGGQAQLVALGRALLHVYALDASSRARPVVLLDEATAALDHATEALIVNIIHEELTCKGYTVVIVAHRLSLVVSNMRDGVDVVVWMANGRIQKIGGVSEIMGPESESESENENRG